MAKKNEIINQKKDNQDLLWILRIIFTLILFVVLYYAVVIYRCTPTINLSLCAAVFIIFLTMVIALKPPFIFTVVVALITILSIMFALGASCPNL